MDSEPDHRNGPCWSRPEQCPSSRMAGDAFMKPQWATRAVVHCHSVWVFPTEQLVRTSSGDEVVSRAPRTPMLA